MEIDKSTTSPSLITKIFLEKEIYNSENEFRNSYKYIDEFWNESFNKGMFSMNVEQLERIELLLGIQTFRKFFLDPNNLEEYVNNKYD